MLAPALLMAATGSLLVSANARLARVVDRLRAIIAQLDGGDEMQGTIISNLNAGRASIDVFNTLGLDAAAIGNHEFDWSVDTLVARMADAR